MTHWDASKRAAAHRLPPPARVRRTMRVTAPPRLPRASVPPVIELDDPTIVDEVDRTLAPPRLLPPPIPAPARRMRSPAPTQIVEPLPAPGAPGARDAESHARILDAESTGGRISGEVVSSAPLPRA